PTFLASPTPGGARSRSRSAGVSVFKQASVFSRTASAYPCKLATVGLKAATCSRESPMPLLLGSAGMSNFWCQPPSIHTCGLPLILAIIPSSTRVACHSVQPMGLHGSVGRLARSASESPLRAPLMKLFRSIFSAWLTTAVASIWFLLLAGNASDNLRSAVDHPAQTAERAALSHSCTWRATQTRFVLLSIVFCERC